jgi:hypothetical protein
MYFICMQAYQTMQEQMGKAAIAALNAESALVLSVLVLHA